MTTTSTAPAGFSPEPAIELRDLVKTLKGGRGRPVRAVDGIDLRIDPGEVVAFLGPNGAGKTTTLDMVLGLTKPDSGTVKVFGEAPRRAVDSGFCLGGAPDRWPAP